MKKSQRTKFRPKMAAAFVIFNIIFAILLAPFVVFWGPFHALKVVAVGSVATSRHPQYLRLFLSEQEIAKIMHANDQQGAGGFGSDIARDKVATDPSAGVEIEDISGQGFKGKVMLIHDPKLVKVAVTTKLGIEGERVSDMVKATGAIAGINGGGFYDPDGKGNGGFPDGLTMHNGTLLHNNIGTAKADSVIGLDDKGKLVIQKMSADDLAKNHVQEAVTFGPALIIDGKPVVVGDGGWGIAPRTGIGQTADGTIIFVVIDGRQPTWSIGATLRDLMNVFADYHAVNAVNLDGGSSSELVYNGKVMNRLWNVFGERYIPTSFVVMPAS